MSRWCALAGALMLLGPATALAIPVWPVMDTPTFVEKSKDMLVVKCINPDVLGGGKDDGLTLIEAEVLLVIKGDWKVGKTRLATIGQPMAAGKRYLMASFGGNVFDTGFLAQSDQAVVEVPADFDLKGLAGKTAVEKAQAVFDARRTQVEGLIRRLQQEKEMLDQAARKSSLAK